MEYQDLTISIEGGTGDTFSVSVLDSPVGEAQGEFRMRLDLEGIARIQATLEAARSDPAQAGPASAAATDLGSRLFDALFAGPVRALLDQSLAVVRGYGRGLRIKIMIDAGDPSLASLANLPWELMYRKDTWEWIGLSKYSPIVRYVALPQVPTPLSLPSPLRVLVVAPSPVDLPAIDSLGVQKWIYETWAGIPAVKVDLVEPATLGALSKRLAAGEYHVLHYIGHMAMDPSDAGVLLFRDDAGAARPVDARTLRVVLDAPSLRLVMLDADVSGREARRTATDPLTNFAWSLVMAGVPAVVTIPSGISDAASSIFLREFYTLLARGQMLDAAVAEGRREVWLSGPGTALNWAAPVLFTRVPDGALFTVTGAGLSELPQLPDDLAQACQKGECALFAGAGLSAPAGYPLWSPFVEGLLNWALDSDLLDANLGPSYSAVLQSGQPDLLADRLVSTLEAADPKGEKLLGYLRHTFHKPSARPTDVHRLLKQIGFACALTTNYDSLLEQALGARAYTLRDATVLLSALAQPDPFVVKLFGDLDAPDTIQVSPSQCRNAVTGNRTFLEFASKLLLSRTVLFAGCSLDGIRWTLDTLGYSASARKHYALVAVSGADWRVRADLLRERYGVEVLPYLASEGHPQVSQFLDLLPKRAGAGAQAGQQARPSREPPRLKSIHLEQIGPFDKLDLELDPNWNILLGDNGVGKSTILRAVALALCGEEAQPYVSRVITYGELNGTVALTFADGASIVAELHREGSRIDRVSTLDVFGTVNWLAIGFPPLRHFGWQPLKGPQELPRRSPATTPGDLLPLVQGDPDSRMIDLKQAIIDLDYRALKEGEGRNRQLFTEFFDVIGELTKGMTFHFDKIDQDHHIWIKTDDGPVPLEAVSQGTHSLMGWVGQLLGRMYDVFPSPAQDPREQPAVVLIDEIDAHMHPTWQQIMVARLSKLFPKVQFLATTHSPLIVAGMPVKQVLRFDRDPEGKVVRLPVEKDVTMGRADQLLTGTLFGLDTTLDVETQDMIDEMQRLIIKRRPSRKDKDRLKELRRQLPGRIPVSPETPPERRAYEFVNALLVQRVSELAGTVNPEQLEAASKELKDKARQLLEEAARPRGKQP